MNDCEGVGIFLSFIILCVCVNIDLLMNIEMDCTYYHAYIVSICLHIYWRSRIILLFPTTCIWLLIDRIWYKNYFDYHYRCHGMEWMADPSISTITVARYSRGESVQSAWAGFLKRVCLAQSFKPSLSAKRLQLALWIVHKGLILHQGCSAYNRIFSPPSISRHEWELSHKVNSEENIFTLNIPGRGLICHIILQYLEWCKWCHEVIQISKRCGWCHKILHVLWWCEWYHKILHIFQWFVLCFFEFSSSWLLI